MPRAHSMSRSPSPSPARLTQEESQAMHDLHKGFMNSIPPGQRDAYDKWLSQKSHTPETEDSDDDRPAANPGELDPNDPKYQQKLRKFMIKHENLGENISDEVKETARALLKTGMDARYLSEIKKKWARPSNMDCLKVPALNPILKKALKGEFEDHKRNDEKMMKIMELLVSVITCNMNTLDFAIRLLAKDCRPMAPVVEALNEAVAFGVKVFSDLIEARRSFLTSDLNSDFKEVLGDRNPATSEWLGGDELTACIEDIKKDDKHVEMLKKHQKKKEQSPGKGRGKGRGFDAHYTFSGPGQFRGYTPRGYGYNGGNPYPTPFQRGGQQGPRFPNPGQQWQGGRGYGQSQNSQYAQNNSGQNNNPRGKGK